VGSGRMLRERRAPPCRGTGHMAARARLTPLRSLTTPHVRNVRCVVGWGPWFRIGDWTRLGVMWATGPGAGGNVIPDHYPQGIERNFQAGSLREVLARAPQRPYIRSK
jgi:hypothetical protein